MLVLVAGVTGNLGQKLIASLTNRGHHVRGLGRNPEKLGEKLDTLERFETLSGYDDIPALNRACAGVDAIICAYGMDPRLQLDGQLLLLRAAERAGHEAYDAYVAFRHHAEMSSPIKPIYVYIGIFAETLFSVYGHGHVGPDMPLVWNPSTKTVNVWGSGHTTWFWTTERDAAEFTAEIVQRDDASQGGFWNVCSGAHSLRQIAETYQHVRGTDVKVNVQGTIDELENKALAARKNGDKRNFHLYTGLFYQLYASDGTLLFRKLDNDKLRVTGTSLTRFLEENPHI
ncbi:NAD(P)-binding protein [Hypoxylon sp. EC38]|nr:NAD(P)-binding protein [Hypoxylon sp. EC38]